MTLEERIHRLEIQMANLQASFLQTARNQVPVVSKVDDTANDVDGLRQDVNEIQAGMFPQWDGNGYDYLTSERVSYEGKYYRCLQSHKSQPDWTPDTAASLWAEISDPAEEWPEWKQPTGAHDAYAKGDKVSHLEKHWTSDIDDNVYEPGVYGWTEA